MLSLKAMSCLEAVLRQFIGALVLVLGAAVLVLIMEVTVNISGEW